MNNEIADALAAEYKFDPAAMAPLDLIDAKDASSIVAWGFSRRRKGDKAESLTVAKQRACFACAKLWNDGWEPQQIVDCLPQVFEAKGFKRETLTEEIVSYILCRAFRLSSRLNFFVLEKILKSRALERELGQAQDAEYIKELNKKHAVVMLGGRCVVMTEEIDPVFNRPDVAFSSIADFQNWYKNKIVPNPRPGRGRKEFVTVANAWLESNGRREYKGIIFDPCKKSNGYYNLWRGLAEKPAPGDWSLFRDHIRDGICSGNEDAFRYLLHWMADAVQNPGGKRPGVSVVLKGKQGTGKGCFATQFGKLFGPHFLHIQSGSQFTGRFNGHLKNALCVFVDEAVWGGDKTAEGVLKGMVTEDLLTIEHKFQDAIQIRNHMRIIIASNNAWIVPAGMEERRFFVLQVSDEHMQDAEYFRAIFRQMDKGGRAAMLHDLLQMDLAGVNLRDFPRTEALFTQTLQSMHNSRRFWYDLLQNGGLDGEEWPVFFVKQSLYESYRAFCKELGDQRPLYRELFTKELFSICPKMEPGKIRFQDEKRRPVYHVPNLETCRADFAAACGGVAIEWGHVGRELKVDMPSTDWLRSDE